MLRTALAVALLAGSMAAVLGGGYALHTSNRDRTIEHFEELELHTAEEAAALLEVRLVGAARSLRSIASALPSTRDPLRVAELLSEQDRCGTTSCFNALAVLGPDGLRQQGLGQPFDLPAASLADAAAWADLAPASPPVRAITSTSEPPALLLLTPVVVHESTAVAPRRTVAAQIDVDDLLDRHRRALGAGWPKYETLVFNADGTMIFDSHAPQMQMHNVFERTAACSHCHDSFAHVERMLSADRGILRFRSGSVDQVAAVAPLTFEGRRWTVVVKVPRDDITRILSAELRQLGVVMLIVVSLLVAAGSLTWREGRRRLHAEAEARQKADLERSHGELTLLNTRLERAANEWRTTVDTIDAALIVVEPTGSIHRMNKAAAATLPETIYAWLGRPSAHLLEYQPWNAALALVGEAVDRQVVATSRFRDEKAGRTWDLWCRALAGQQRPVVLILARDVTTVVELQESVRRSETMAALGSIVVGVAHEVRNPLFAISSLVDAWAVQPHRDPRPFVDALRGEVSRLRTLMVELLEYGRPAKFTRRTDGLLGVIDGAVRSCSHEALARGVQILTSARADAEVLMDARRLERVFINLIQNAVQHAPPQSIVHVDLIAPGTADAAGVDVVVRDSGAGFAPEELPRLFTPFFSHRAGGFGLGLAITERIVHEHQGHVTAANHPSGGAMMTVSLPLIQVRPVPSGREVESSC
jgi:signal transduction histidine kinase